VERIERHDHSYGRDEQRDLCGSDIAGNSHELLRPTACRSGRYIWRHGSAGVTTFTTICRAMEQTRRKCAQPDERCDRRPLESCSHARRMARFTRSRCGWRTVSIGGVAHNVIVAATAHDSVYVYDADASPCVTYWHFSLLDTSHGGTAGEVPVPSGTTGSLVGLGVGDITPGNGSDWNAGHRRDTGTIYVVSKSVITSGPTFFQRNSRAGSGDRQREIQRTGDNSAHR